MWLQACVPRSSGPRVQLGLAGVLICAMWHVYCKPCPPVAHLTTYVTSALGQQRCKRTMESLTVLLGKRILHSPHLKFGFKCKSCWDWLHSGAPNWRSWIQPVPLKIRICTQFQTFCSDLHLQLVLAQSGLKRKNWNLFSFFWSWVCPEIMVMSGYRWVAPSFRHNGP